MKATAEVRKFLASIGGKGGNARAKTLSPERRREIARLGGSAPKRKRASKRPA